MGRYPLLTPSVCARGTKPWPSQHRQGAGGDLYPTTRAPCTPPPARSVEKNHWSPCVKDVDSIENSTLYETNQRRKRQPNFLSLVLLEDALHSTARNPVVSWRYACMALFASGQHNKNHILPRNYRRKTHHAAKRNALLFCRQSIPPWNAVGLSTMNNKP